MKLIASVDQLDLFKIGACVQLPDFHTYGYIASVTPREDSRYLVDLEWGDIWEEEFHNQQELYREGLI